MTSSVRKLKRAKRKERELLEASEEEPASKPKEASPKKKTNAANIREILKEGKTNKNDQQILDVQLGHVREVGVFLRELLIRRTRNSKDWEGKPIQGLEPAERIDFVIPQGSTEKRRLEELWQVMADDNPE